MHYFYFLHAIFCSDWVHKPAKQWSITNFAFFAKNILSEMTLWYCHISICDVTRTRGTGIMTSYSSTFLVRAKWRRSPQQNNHCQYQFPATRYSRLSVKTKKTTSLALSVENHSCNHLTIDQQSTWINVQQDIWRHVVSVGNIGSIINCWISLIVYNEDIQ